MIFFKIIFFLVVYFLISNNLIAQTILGDISNRDINITASFKGAKIIIYGVVNPEIYNDTNIYVSVVGPKTKAKLRKKVNRYGLWLSDNQYININYIPSYYAISSNNEVHNMSSSLFKSIEIGWNNINILGLENKKHSEQYYYKEKLKEIYQEKQLYVSKLNQLDVIENTLFRAEFNLPVITPIGDYEVNMYLVDKNNNILISSWHDKIFVAKEGFSAELYKYSKNNSLLYGIFAALGAILFGLLASEIFRRI